MRESEKLITALDIFYSLAVNYPIIRSFGYNLTQPIAFVTQSEEQIGVVQEYLTTFRPQKIVNSSLTPKKCKKILADANSEYVFLHCSRDTSMQSNLRLAICAAKTGRLGDQDVGALSVIFACPAIPEELREECFQFILTDEEIPTLPIKSNRLLDMVKALKGQLPLVQDRAVRITGGTTWERALKCAACFYLPMLKRQDDNAEEKFEALLRACELICEKNEEAQESDGISDIFVAILYDWVQKNRNIKAYATDNIPGITLGDRILYDTQFLYIPESLFCEIIHPLKNSLSGPLIKLALKDTGLLVCNQTKTYTTKVLTYNVYGATHRERMLKFSLARLCRTGDVPLLQLFSDDEGDETNA